MSSTIKLVIGMGENKTIQKEKKPGNGMKIVWRPVPYLYIFFLSITVRRNNSHHIFQRYYHMFLLVPGQVDDVQSTFFLFAFWIFIRPADFSERQHRGLAAPNFSSLKFIRSRILPGTNSEPHFPVRSWIVARKQLAIDLKVNYGLSVNLLFSTYNLSSNPGKC